MRAHRPTTRVADALARLLVQPGRGLPQFAHVAEQRDAPRRARRNASEANAAAIERGSRCSGHEQRRAVRASLPCARPSARRRRERRDDALSGSSLALRHGERREGDWRPCGGRRATGAAAETVHFDARPAAPRSSYAAGRRHFLRKAVVTISAFAPFTASSSSGESAPTNAGAPFGSACTSDAFSRATPSSEPTPSRCAAGVRDDRGVRSGDGRERGDLARRVHAHLDDRDTVLALEAEDRERHAPVVCSCLPCVAQRRRFRRERGRDEESSWSSPRCRSRRPSARASACGTRSRSAEAPS